MTDNADLVYFPTTSCLVVGQADIVLQIFLRDALNLILPKLAGVVQRLSKFAIAYRDLPCLGYTHGQPAQLVTVGKRASLWITDLLDDLHNLEYVRERLLSKFRGVKGATGTQASFLEIFKGDHDKVKSLDKLVTEAAGFHAAEISTSQTYSRKIDTDVVHALSSFGSTCERTGGDIRHLAMFKELEEPFEADQIGSSAMAYKRNPMRSERLCSLGRKLRNFSADAEQTYASQWLERSLDDSAIRRIVLPESFLCADACLILLNNVSSGMVVNKAVIQHRIDQELPFMATENVIMAMGELVRQSNHYLCVAIFVANFIGRAIQGKKCTRRSGMPETQRSSYFDVTNFLSVLSHQAGAVVKQEGKPNDLLDRIRATKYFQPIIPELQALIDPAAFTGRSAQIVQELVETKVAAALEKYAGVLASVKDAELNV